MNYRMILTDSRDAYLTTEHSASSYGEPVLLVEATAYSAIEAARNYITIHFAAAECEPYQHAREAADEFHVAGEPTREAMRAASEQLALEHERKLQEFYRELA